MARARKAAIADGIKRIVKTELQLSGQTSGISGSPSCGNAGGVFAH
jgi:hypothetical protein